MTDADIAEFIGYMFAAYATGWGSGYLIYSWKRLTDFI
jgi:hypothetical protein